VEIHEGAAYLTQYMGMDNVQAYEISRQLIDWVRVCLSNGETPVVYQQARENILILQTGITRLHSEEEVFQAYASRWPLAAVLYDECGFPSRIRGIPL